MLTPDQERALERFRQQHPFITVLEGFDEDQGALVTLPNGEQRRLDRWGHDTPYKPPPKENL